MTPRGRISLTPFPLAIALGVAACGGAEPPPPVPPAPPPPAAMTPQPPPPAVAAPAAPAASLPEVGFGPATPSDAPKKAPKVTIAAPKADQVVAADKAKDFQVKVNVKEWETQERGPHVHVLLDNNAYRPVYDLKAPIKLSDLIGPSDTLAEGEHVLVAFPSRMNHESVKAPGAIAITRFWIGKKGQSAMKAAKDPMMFFSRPKGTYNGPMADHVLVDWYLVNAELGDNKMSIKATVQGPGLDAAGRQLVIKEWRPYVLENLRSGEYTIAMELDDKDGKAVPGAFGSTTRKFVVNREAHDEGGPPPGAEGPKKGDHEHPKADGPKAEHPKADGPKADGPKADGPKADGPKAEHHKADGPKGEHPKADGPKAEHHKADGPKAEPPKADKK
jgi:hypothetical protein